MNNAALAAVALIAVGLLFGLTCGRRPPSQPPRVRTLYNREPSRN